MAGTAARPTNVLRSASIAGARLLRQLRWRYGGAGCVGQLLCDCWIGGGGADWIAVRGYDAGGGAASTTYARGWGCVCHADGYSLRYRVAFVGLGTGSMAVHRCRLGSLGPYRRVRSRVRGRRGSADAAARCLSTGVRGLAMSCDTAAGGVRDTRDLGIRDSVAHARGPVRCRRRDVAVAFHRYPQRVGQPLVPCVFERTRYQGMSEGDRMAGTARITG